MNELLRAMIAASLTTMAGFLALLFGVLPAMKVLGIILSIGNTYNFNWRNIFASSSNLFIRQKS